jgi:hypothetical protein
LVKTPSGTEFSELPNRPESLFSNSRAFFLKPTCSGQAGLRVFLKCYI